MNFLQKTLDYGKTLVTKANNFRATLKQRLTPSGSVHAPIGVHTSRVYDSARAWSLSSAQCALDAFDQGNFHDAAVMMDAMIGEGRVFSTLDSRVKATLGGKRIVEKSTAPNAESALISRAIAKNVSSWYFDAVPHGTHETILKNLIMLGFCLCESSYARRDDTLAVYPTLTVHNARNVRYELSSNRWFLRTIEHGEIEVQPGDGRWVLFTIGGDSRPWLNGAIRSLAFPWLLLRQTVVDWGRRTEFEATGIRKAIVPTDYNVDRVNKFLKQLKNLGSDSVVAIPQGYDLQIIAADLGAADSFARLADRCDTTITLVLLGQNLTTQIEGGSYAASATHARVQLERVQADVQTLSFCLKKQLIEKWIEYNFDGLHRDYAPTISFDTAPPEDAQKKAQGLLTLSQALPVLAAHGADVQAILEAFGVPLVDGDEATAPMVYKRILELVSAGILSREEARLMLGYGPSTDGATDGTADDTADDITDGTADGVTDDITDGTADGTQEGLQP